MHSLPVQLAHCYRMAPGKYLAGNNKQDLPSLALEDWTNSGSLSKFCMNSVKQSRNAMEIVKSVGRDLAEFAEDAKYEFEKSGG